jgi:hypothetical protein
VADGGLAEFGASNDLRDWCMPPSKAGTRIDWPQTGDGLTLRGVNPSRHPMMISAQGHRGHPQAEDPRSDEHIWPEVAGFSWLRGGETSRRPVVDPLP